MKSVDKLRTLPRHGTNGFGAVVTVGEETIEAIVDEIEREIAEHYMELPVDADGVPIWVGDTVEFGESRNQGIVKALNEHMIIAMHVEDGYMNYAKYGLLWNADECRHVKPRTLEDVLAEFGRESVGASMQQTNALLARYADEIRELMGGDAE